MAAKKWPSCNVFEPGSDQHRVWHFDLKGKQYVAKGEDSLPAGQPLPAGIASKNWKSIIQPRLNVAWLPSEHVFLRVVQLPECTAEELASMLDLQLEKLSPLPVAQIVWSAQALGEAEAGMQTVLVVMASVGAAETFLGTLEESGLCVDRLDVPAVDQLMALKPEADGAWILPDLTGIPSKALVGWWFGGVLKSLGLIELPAEGEPGVALRDQLMQMAWAGEIEGWLTQTPQWNLLAGDATRETWHAALTTGLKDDVQVVEPSPPDALALSCANRAGHAGAMVRGLLPEEFATRYRQQFTDRLWMRGLGALMVLYVAGVIAYFGLLGVENWRLSSVEEERQGLGLTYTNALELKARFEVLRDLQELKYAALDCWQLASETIPSGVTLDGLNFKDGQTFTLNGSAPEDAVSELIDFSADLRKAELNGKPMFDSTQGKQLTYKQSPRAAVVNWNFSLVLKRSEVR